jgi:hypothetical protein
MTAFPAFPRPEPVRLMRRLGLEPDPWQIDVLESDHPRKLLNCSRQSGKSTTVAVSALASAIWTPFYHVILLSRSHRQSRELFGKVLGFHRELGDWMLARRTAEELVLKNGSRIVSLPCREETIRGYSNVHLLIIDEAARVPDDVYRAVRPMLAVSGGRLICLSTPYGRRGFFWQAWATGGDDWLRVEVPAERIPRISPAFLAEERRQQGESYFRQEYCCSFEALEGLVYPDFARCVVPGPAPESGTRVGGIDFGFRNPFAALWGLHDRDGVLWLTGEHYARQKPLDYHVARMPREVLWHCDPAGAQERAELIRAGLRVRKGINNLRSGIMAVTARLESGRLRVVAGACPNLLYEAALYRYGNESEAPVDEHNHALAALRYLVSRLDEGRMGRPGRRPPPESGDEPAAESAPPQPGESWWKRYDNPDLWTRVG